ncbi:hypothetical protein [Corallococcus sicarius]|nr:hypothetical protein [Corallococcus sicarius]
MSVRRTAWASTSLRMARMSHALRSASARLVLAGSVPFVWELP